MRNIACLLCRVALKAAECGHVRTNTEGIPMIDRFAWPVFSGVVMCYVRERGRCSSKGAVRRPVPRPPQQQNPPSPSSRATKVAGCRQLKQASTQQAAGGTGKGHGSRTMAPVPRGGDAGLELVAQMGRADLSDCAGGLESRTSNYDVLARRNAERGVGARQGLTSGGCLLRCQAAARTAPL